MGSSDTFHTIFERLVQIWRLICVISAPDLYMIHTCAHIFNKKRGKNGAYGA